MNQYPAQAIRHEPEVVRGLEILNFNQVELEKTKEDGSQTFATLGDLRVLYFDYYERFLLQINNWKYCLLPKLPITGAPSQSGEFSQIYRMPTDDGTYILRLGQNFSPIALHNFEMILSNTSKFFREGGQLSMRRPGESALGENGLVASQINYSGGQGQGGRYFQWSGEMRQSYDVNTVIGTYSQSKKKSGLKTKVKAFKDRLKGKNKATRGPNPNMMQLQDFTSIKMTSQTMVPVYEFRRQEIEDIIAASRAVIRKLEGPILSQKEDVKEKVYGVVDAIKEGVHDMKERYDERNEHEAETGEKIGVMTILKEGVHDIKEKIMGKHPEIEGGEFEDTNHVTQQSTSTKKVGFAAAVMAGVHEFKAKMTESNEQQATTNEEKRGIMTVVKEGVYDLKGKISGSHGQTESEQQGHGLMTKVKESVYSIRDRLGGSHVQTESEQQGPGLMGKVRESVYSIRDRLAAKISQAQEMNHGANTIEEVTSEQKAELLHRFQEENKSVLLTPQPKLTASSLSPSTNRGMYNTDPRHKTISLLNSTPPSTSERRRLRIFDDKYLDQPINENPFPISGAAGMEMIKNYDEFTHSPSRQRIEERPIAGHILDDKHLDQPLATNPFPLSGGTGVDLKEEQTMGRSVNPDIPLFAEDYSIKRSSPAGKSDLAKYARPVVFKDTDQGTYSTFLPSTAGEKGLMREQEVYYPSETREIVKESLPTTEDRVEFEARDNLGVSQNRRESEGLNSYPAEQYLSYNSQMGRSRNTDQQFENANSQNAVETLMAHYEA